jgi:hypothetical protein
MRARCDRVQLHGGKKRWVNSSPSIFLFALSH